MKNHANRQSKAAHEYLEKQLIKIQEASEHITMWRNSIICHKTSFKEKSTQKEKEKGNIRTLR